jgi:hypothetical protein
MYGANHILPANRSEAEHQNLHPVVAAFMEHEDSRSFQREEVRQQLETLGIDPDEAAQRALSLSDAEVQQIAGQLDQLPAGRDAVGVVITAILIVLLVLLITDLLGLTNVFPFVRAQR